MEKTKYCKVTIAPTFCVYKSVAEAMSQIEATIFSFIDGGESVDVKFEEIELTDEEYENLPEFDGF